MLAAQGHFVLSRPEAEKREVKQIGVSSCGATAILNALVSQNGILSQFVTDN